MNHIRESGREDAEMKAGQTAAYLVLSIDIKGRKLVHSGIKKTARFLLSGMESCFRSGWQLTLPLTERCRGHPGCVKIGQPMCDF